MRYAEENVTLEQERPVWHRGTFIRLAGFSALIAGASSAAWINCARNESDLHDEADECYCQAVSAAIGTGVIIGLLGSLFD